MRRSRTQIPKAIISGLSFVVLAAAITLGVIYINSNSVKATTVSFSFGSGGDHGNHADAQSVFEAAGLSGIDFFQTNGDLSYLDSPTSNTATATTEWCSMVNSKLGSIPFLTLNGNHEEPGAHTGLDGDNIDDVIAPGCLPKPASMNVVESPNKTGTLGTTPTNYGREYYYDYPAVNPIARFIAVSADIKTYVGGDYDYTVGSSHYNWVQARVQEAKLSGMWVVVINHTPTMNTGGSHGGTDYSTVTPLFNMLIDENVDLILSGHEHNYQRSKQIGGASCDYVFNTYSSSCMANSSTSSYTAGNGPIIVITGSTGGNYTTGDGNMVAINSSDPDYPYFAATMGYGSPNATKGFSKFDVTDTSITGHFVPGVGQTGGFTDTFTITRPDTTAPTVTLDTPSAGTVSGTVSMTATASDAVGVTKVEFYQGATKLGEDLSSPYAYSWDSTTVANGNYSLTAKALDAAGNIGTSNTVYVTVSNGSSDTTAPTVTLDTPSAGTVSGTVSMTATASDAVGVTKVEFYQGATKLGEDLSSPYAYSWDSTTVANGNYSLTAKALDAAGNIGTSNTVYVTVSNGSSDTTAPTVTLDTPSAGTVSGTVSMTATASDAVGVTKVEFYQGATKLGEDLSSPYAYSWDSTTVANGNYSLTAKALDAAGNIGTSNTVYVTVSNGSGATPVTSFTMAGPSSSSITFTTSGQCSSITSHTIADTTKAPSGQTLLVGAEFSLSCAAASNTATIVIGLGASYDTSKLRVHKLAGTTLTDITSLVTFGTSGGYTTVSYTVTDGGFGDEDSSSNAIIDDPIYVTNVAGVSTVNTTTLANTGIDSILLISVAVGMIGFGLIGALTIGYKRVNR
jgi:hypothetical protein